MEHDKNASLGQLSKFFAISKVLRNSSAYAHAVMVKRDACTDKPQGK